MTWLSDAVVEHLRQLGDTPLAEASRYQIREEIGRGGMAVVYLAFDRQLRRDVALKMLHPGHAEETSRRLQHEAQIIGCLEHPGIVPIHDVGVTEDGRPFYVMKLVKGMRLDAWLNGGVGLAERLRVFDRVCEAVAFAHQRGIIHRDLKPENVMIGGFGEVLVMDWGVAKVRVAREVDTGAAATNQDGTSTGAIIGTPGYMAPEQERGASASADERTDVYALGRILEHLLEAATYEDRPPALLAVAATAQAREPAMRYPTVTALAADVRRFAAGGAVTAYRESLSERALRVMRPYRAAILLVAVYLVARVALIVLDLIDRQ